MNEGSIAAKKDYIIASLDDLPQDVLEAIHRIVVLSQSGIE